jgi:hypothetical protein
VGVSESCETFKWVVLEMEKDFNFSLVLKLGRSNDRWWGLGQKETVLLSDKFEKFRDKLGCLRTTTFVVVNVVAIVR